MNNSEDAKNPLMANKRKAILTYNTRFLFSLLYARYEMIHNVVASMLFMRCNSFSNSNPNTAISPSSSVA